MEKGIDVANIKENYENPGWYVLGYFQTSTDSWVAVREVAHGWLDGRCQNHYNGPKLSDRICNRKRADAIVYSRYARSPLYSLLAICYKQGSRRST